MPTTTTRAWACLCGFEMNEVIKWQDGTVDVQAALIPRFVWTVASIDVLLYGQCILQTGGQMKLTGSHSTSFNYCGSSHTVTLSWGRKGLAPSFPFELRIDDVQIAD